MKYLILLLCILGSYTSQALNLKSNSPSRYVIREGDNLWSIANHYLTNPWEWKELWHANPQINNPNRLYAGDVLILDYTNSGPYIKVEPNGTIKLSPKPRLSSLPEAIPAIPLEIIKPFLNESLVLDENILGFAPYIVAYMGEHMLGGQGNEVYVKGLHPSKELPKGGTIGYSIFRQGAPYKHPMTKELLGYKATLVGYGELIAGGEPATMVLTNIIEGVKKEDLVLINNSPELDLYYVPSAPTTKVLGFIIDMLGGIPSGGSQGAVGQVIVLSLGAQNGLKSGDVLGLYGKPRVIKDPKNSYIPIQLPPERLGEAMVFRTFTKTSFALIIRSIRPIYFLDTVANP
ncbi:MAG: LysM peptidoglycan-binding domain-containing protein [Legionellales bacterium]